MTIMEEKVENLQEQNHLKIGLNNSKRNSMKKTLQECKEIVANERGWNDWKQVLSYITATENLSDLANKMYYEQSEEFYCKDFTEDEFLSNDEKCKNQCAACRNKSLPNHPQK
jgi:hypothetical protein